MKYQINSASLRVQEFIPIHEDPSGTNKGTIIDPIPEQNKADVEAFPANNEHKIDVETYPADNEQKIDIESFPRHEEEIIVHYNENGDTDVKTKPPTKYPVHVEKVGKNYPRNAADHAGQKYPLPPELEAKYGELWFKENGCPDFTPHATKVVKVEGLTGKHSVDERKANLVAGFKETPNDHTWHHHEDGITMELVPSDLHGKVGHTGGAAVRRHIFKGVK